MSKLEWMRWFKANLLIAIAILATLAFSYFAFLNYERTVELSGWVSHTQQLLYKLKSARRLVDETLSNERGYLLTRQGRFLDQFEAVLARAPAEIRDISRLLSDNPVQSQRALQLQADFETFLEETREGINLAKNGLLREASARVANGEMRAVAESIRSLLESMEEEERHLLDERINAVRSTTKNTRVSLIFGMFFTVSALLAAVQLVNQRLKTQMQAERELNRFFSTSLDMFCIFDKDARLVRFNPRFEAVLGYTPSELEGTRLVDKFHPDDYARGLRAHQDQSLQGMVVADFECRVRCKSGEYRWLSWKSVPAPREGLIYAVARDVTDRHRLEEENEAAKRAAEQANRAKSDFLASMSHEIRTPLNSIIGMADVLSETPLNEEQARYVRVFRSAGNSLFNLINDLLDLSKIEAGKIEIEESDFDLHELIAQAMDLFSLRASQKGLVLDWTLEAAVPRHIRGDSSRLRQVLANLVGNAVKYTETGEVRLRVKQDPAGHDLRFEISDTGPGIPEEAQPRLFGKYERMEAGSGKHHGTGLGLYISQQLVERMGGKIGFTSVFGQGTLFYFTIPLQLAGLTASPKSELPAQPERTLRILLVDDNEDNRLLVRSYLKKYPHQIVQAENGQQALELFQNEKFDLVFMDLHMPSMDGLTATKRIREWEATHHCPPTPIVALTAYSLKEEAEKCLEAGCSAHISKPVKRDTLIKVIQEFYPKSERAQGD